MKTKNADEVRELYDLSGVSISSFAKYVGCSTKQISDSLESGTTNQLLINRLDAWALGQAKPKLNEVKKLQHKYNLSRVDIRTLLSISMSVENRLFAGEPVSGSVCHLLDVYLNCPSAVRYSAKKFNLKIEAPTHE